MANLRYCQYAKVYCTVLYCTANSYFTSRDLNWKTLVVWCTTKYEVYLVRTLYEGSEVCEAGVAQTLGLD